jgi:hypothetical protein
MVALTALFDEWVDAWAGSVIGGIDAVIGDLDLGEWPADLGIDWGAVDLLTDWAWDCDWGAVLDDWGVGDWCTNCEE